MHLRYLAALLILGILGCEDGPPVTTGGVPSATAESSSATGTSKAKAGESCKGGKTKGGNPCDKGLLCYRVDDPV